MISIEWRTPLLVIRCEGEDLSPRQENQLAFWRFARDPLSGEFAACPDDPASLVSRVVAFLKKGERPLTLCLATRAMIDEMERRGEGLRAAIREGGRVKAADLDAEIVGGLHQFQHERLARPLKSHQFKALLHLLATGNGANFSVPGSGKTAVVLAAFQWLRDRGECDSLFVVGPPSCFGPWQQEYRVVLGREPSAVVLAGGDRDSRHSKYFADGDSASDLYLTTFQTLQRDWELVRSLFENQGLRFFLVVDEAHYIKQAEGAWASAVMEVARHAARRCVLTGTPFPRSYTDGFNLFDVLWPTVSPLSVSRRQRIADLEAKQDPTAAAVELRSAIGPLFYRVRKRDLGLSEPDMHDPLVLQMRPVERFIYDAIIDRIQFLNDQEYIANLETLVRLRRGRIMRLRQCVSLVPLLRTALAGYEEDLAEGSPDVRTAILAYRDRETPAKADALVGIATPLLAGGQKIVIWSNFVGTLRFIETLLAGRGFSVRLIYGATPTEAASVDEAETREGIIREFKRPGGEVQVLVANPAACAESISLHTACSHAIYYDLSYNCAQFLQSLDRIHRVGGSETKVSHYHFLQYADTIEQDIWSNLALKRRRMSALIDEDCPILDLDMTEEPGEEEDDAYRRIFGG